MGIDRLSCCIGTWQCDSNAWMGASESLARETLTQVIASGFNRFDTAPIYGSGWAETLLGEVFSGQRDQFHLSTKVAPQHLTAARLRGSVQRSCHRLQTHYIDACLVHWPAGSFRTQKVAYSETFGALADLHAQGVVRSIGVSNFSLSQLKKAMIVAPIDVVQLPLSLFCRGHELAYLPFCREHGIQVMAYSPLAQGYLVDQPRSISSLTDNRRKNKLFSDNRWCAAADQLRPVLQQMAVDQAVTLQTLALWWLRQYLGVMPVVGIRTPAQASELRVAVSVEPEIDYEVLSTLTEPFLGWSNQY